MQQALPGVGRRIVVATHRRSGTHLAIDLLRRHFPACRARKRIGEGVDTLYLNLDRLRTDHRQPIGAVRAEALLRRARRPLVKTHELPRWLADDDAFAREVLRDADLWCVVRDGRDVLCSLYAFVRSYDRHAPTSFSAFLREEAQGVSRARRWADEVRACLAVPGVQHLAFEEIIDDPARVIGRLADALSLEAKPVEPLLPVPVRSRWGSRWRRLFSRSPEATSIPGGGRRMARWRETFSPEDRAFFHEQAGDLLIELGYEGSDGWVNGLAA